MKNTYYKIDNKKAFSLIEVVVSAIILSLTVFWVYKLIAENNKIINNSNNYLDANMLIANAISCIENMWDSLITNYSTQTWSFYFENTLTWKCMTWSYDSNFTFNSVKLNNIDYYLYWKINSFWTDFVNWNIWVYSDSTWKIEKEYKMNK